MSGGGGAKQRADCVRRQGLSLRQGYRCRGPREKREEGGRHPLMGPPQGHRILEGRKRGGETIKRGRAPGAADLHPTGLLREVSSNGGQNQASGRNRRRKERAWEDLARRGKERQVYYKKETGGEAGRAERSGPSQKHSLIIIAKGRSGRRDSHE